MATNDNLKVNPGDAVTAKRWNRVIDKLPENTFGGPNSVGLVNQDTVSGQAPEGTDVALGEAMIRGAIASDGKNPFDLGDADVVEMESFSASDWPQACERLLVPTRPIKGGEIGPVVYNGGALVKLASGGFDGDCVFPDSANPAEMKTGTSGYQLVTRFTDESENEWGVVNLADTQPLWKFRTTEATEAGTTTVPADIQTLRGQTFGQADVKLLACFGALQASVEGYCHYADGAFHAVEICQSSGPAAQRRIKFRLKTSFSDTGQADALVINTYGTAGVSPGDIVQVNDPQKLFAEAIGSDFVTIPPSSVFPCGGSVGFAVLTDLPIGACTVEGSCAPGVTAQDCQYAGGTFELGVDCNGDPIEIPSRWEVEQCSQAVNRLLVSVYPHQGTHSQPTGETDPIPEDEVELYFSDAESILSRAPYTDYDLGIYPNPWSEVPYVYAVKADNPGRFSALPGSLVTLEAVPRTQRLQDGCNQTTPYNPQNPERTRWQITEVHSPLARWIRAKYVDGDSTENPWEYADTFAEGEDPLMYFGGIPGALADAIKTAPGFEGTCIKKDEPGWAFWNPNTQEYYVVATKSAMYGTAKSVELVGQEVSEDSEELIKFDGCDLKYKKSSSWFMFGDNGDKCPVEVTDEQTSPTLYPVEVITGVTRVGYNLVVSKSTILTCQETPGVDSYEYICCPEELVGCCLNYDGTYTPDVTQDACERPESGAPPGEWLGPGSECPQAECFYCEVCTVCEGVILQSTTIKTASSPDPNFSESLFNIEAEVMTSGCTLTLNGYWTSPGMADVTGVLTMTLMPDDGNGPWVKLEASPATIYGFQVDGWKLLWSAYTHPCDDGYGTSFGQGVEPLNGQADHVWDELNADATCCTPEAP